MALDSAIIIGILVVLGFLVLWLIGGFRVAMEYERLVIFRFGRYKRTIGPGICYIIPIVERAKKIDMRIITQDIPRQEVMTRDNIPVLANTVVYFKVEHPEDAVVKIENYVYAVRQYTQAALRDVFGTMELDEVLTERDRVAKDIRLIVDTETADWGIDIKGIKIQEMELPAEMKRAFAKQAEAERDRRAMIIKAEGELEAAKTLAAAAKIIAAEPAAIQLRTLQTIRDISKDPSEKVVIFMPSGLQGLAEGLSKTIKP